MSYCDFTMLNIEKQFNLTIDEAIDLYSSVHDIAISDQLKAILDEQVLHGHSFVYGPTEGSTK